LHEEKAPRADGRRGQGGEKSERERGRGEFANRVWGAWKKKGDRNIGGGAAVAGGAGQKGYKEKRKSGGMPILIAGGIGRV